MSSITGGVLPALVLLALLPAASAFFLGLHAGVRSSCSPEMLAAACTHTPARRNRSTRPRCSAPPAFPVAMACTSAAVAVGPATEQMFGALAQLRVGELSKNFGGMTQREAELLEMNKHSQGTVCLVATAPATDPCAAGLPIPDAPGSSNVREMLALGWVTRQAHDERLADLQREWKLQLATGDYRAVVGAVDVQHLKDSGFFPLPLPTKAATDDSLFYLCNMVVREETRGVGIGKKLLAAALAHARANDAQTVCLQVRRNNESAQRLYRKAGFSETDTETSRNVIRSITATVETTDESECDLLILNVGQANVKDFEIQSSKDSSP